MTPPEDIRRGLGYMLAAAVLFSIMSLLVKLGGRSLPSMQLVAARVVVTFTLGLITLRRAGVSPWGNRRGMLVVRGAVGTTALCAFYYALTELPLADATAIQFTSPAITAVLAAALLGEGLRRADVAGALLGVSGVFLIARPSFLFGAPSPLPPLGLAAGTFAAFVSAFAYLAVRILRRTDHPLVVVFWFPLVAAPVVLPWAALVWVPPTGVEWLVMLGVGTATHFAQVAMTRGIFLLPAARATAVGYLQILFAFVIGLALFDESPDLWNISGAALIVGGTLLGSGLRPRNPTRLSPIR